MNIQKLAKLIDKYASELEKYYLKCQFCGCILDESTVNTFCEKNNSNDMIDNNGLNDEKLLVSFKPKENIYGNKRHYFIKPKDSDAKFKVDYHFDKNTSIEGFSSDKQ